MAAKAHQFSDGVIRLCDALIAAIFLVVSLPFTFPIMAILRVTGEGEVFFRQQRVGRFGERFHLIKFATMLKASETIGAGEITLPNDNRVLPFGRFLRMTKLNEIPQLWNILLGDMSLIGPRPQTPRYFQQCPENLKPLISSVKPGLSGAASVVFRDEESLFADVADVITFDNDVVMPFKYRIEAWYVEHRSLSLYIKLLLLTFTSVLAPRNRWVLKFFKCLPAPPDEVASWLS